jgi:hypothetical protein
MDYLPLGRNPIGNKLVFKVKAKPNGSVVRFKARLLAQDLSQRAGVDNSETFSLVVWLSTMRVVMVIAAKRNMHVQSANIETTFPNANLQEDTYIGAGDETPRVMRLFKSIYELKQASREWCMLFHRTLSSLELKRATSETSLYTMNHPMCFSVLSYIDDIHTVSYSLKWIESAKWVIGNNSARHTLVKPSSSSGLIFSETTKQGQ